MSRQQEPKPKKNMQLFYPQGQNQFATNASLENELQQICDSANNDRKYIYAQNDQTRQFLREELRANYGFNRLIPRSCPRSPSTVSHFGVTTAASIFGAVVMGGGASALAWHLGLFSFIAQAAIPAANTLAVSGVVGVGVITAVLLALVLVAICRLLFVKPECVVSEGSVQKQQQGVKLYYDQSNCSKKQAQQIQQCKAGMRLPRDVDKHRLESLASHAVVRGTVQQRYDMSLSRRLCKLDQPRERRFYYLNMPKLGRGSFDLGFYCKKYQGKYILKEDMCDALKFKFKSILSLAIKVAAENGEGFNVVTPNAFFYGLRRDQQTQAKQLFLDAVIEVAKEIDVTQIRDFKGLFLHSWLKDAATKLAGAAPEFKIPVIFMGDKDASSAQRIAQEEGFGWGVAESLMGEALGAVGNGAMGPMANKAKEENDTRQCPDMIRVFGPGWKQGLLGEEDYQSLDLNSLRVNCGKGPGAGYDAPAKSGADAQPLGPTPSVQ